MEQQEQKPCKKCGSLYPFVGCLCLPPSTTVEDHIRTLQAANSTLEAKNVELERMLTRTRRERDDLRAELAKSQLPPHEEAKLMLHEATKNLNGVTTAIDNLARFARNAQAELDKVSLPDPKVTLDALVNFVAEHYKCTRVEILGESRKHHVGNARRVIAWVALNRLKIAPEKIEAALKRDQRTVYLLIHGTQQRMRQSAGFHDAITATIEFVRIARTKPET